MNKRTSIGGASASSLVLTALSAALTFLGIQSFRIPLPAAVGAPFIHFGHVFVLLGVLLLGGKRGAAAGAIGLVLFDLINGYAFAIPNVLVSTILTCLIAGAVIAAMRRWSAKKPGHARRLAAVEATVVVYVLLTLVLDVIFQTAQLVIAGSVFQAALITVLASEGALLINGAANLILVPLLYFPLSAALKRANLIRLEGEMQ